MTPGTNNKLIKSVVWLFIQSSGPTGENDLVTVAGRINPALNYAKRVMQDTIERGIFPHISEEMITLVCHWTGRPILLIRRIS